MKNKILKIVIIVISIALIAFIIYSFFSPDDDIQKKSGRNKGIKKFDAFIVKSDTLMHEITVSGSLLPDEEVELRNEIQGRIVSINLPEGEYVKEGTLLVKFFDDDLKAGLKKLDAQKKMQEQILESQAELLKVDGISRIEFEQTAYLLNSINADIDALTAQIRKTEVRAPFNGIVGLRRVSVGAVVQPQTLLATFRSADFLKLDFYIPEKHGADIKKDMKINFTTFNSEYNYKATVLATEYGIDSETRNMKVRAVVDNPTDKLIPGAYANVVVQLGKNSNALMVPTQAIIPKEQSKSLIVARNGKAHFIDVKTGIRLTKFIEITEGIIEGDTVITTGIMFLKEGDELQYSTISDSL